MTELTQLIGYDSERISWEVSGYPYGYNKRTEIRYWIESKEGFGQRYAGQTKNPKTGLWNTPKYSTYSPIIVMASNDDEYVKFFALTQWATIEQIKDFENEYDLDDFQKAAILKIKLGLEVSKHLEWKITAPGEKEQTHQEQVQIVKGVMNKILGDK